MVLLRVERDALVELQLYDGQTLEQEQQGELKTRFLDGKLYGYASLSQNPRPTGGAALSQGAGG